MEHRFISKWVDTGKRSSSLTSTTDQHGPLCDPRARWCPVSIILVHVLVVVEGIDNGSDGPILPEYDGLHGVRCMDGCTSGEVEYREEEAIAYAHKGEKGGLVQDEALELSAGRRTTQVLSEAPSPTVPAYRKRQRLIVSQRQKP